MNGDDLKIYSDHALRGGATSVKQIHPSSEEIVPLKS